MHLSILVLRPLPIVVFVFPVGSIVAQFVAALSPSKGVFAHVCGQARAGRGADQFGRIVGGHAGGAAGLLPHATRWSIDLDGRIVIGNAAV